MIQKYSAQQFIILPYHNISQQEKFEAQTSQPNQVSSPSSNQHNPQVFRTKYVILVAVFAVTETKKSLQFLQ